MVGDGVSRINKYFHEIIVIEITVTNYLYVSLPEVIFTLSTSTRGTLNNEVWLFRSHDLACLDIRKFIRKSRYKKTWNSQNIIYC